MWLEYIKERQGHEVSETENGFISWHIEKYGKDNVLSLNDIYIRPKARDGKELQELYNLAIKQGKANNCKYILAYVEVNTKGADKRLLMHIFKFKFKVIKAENGKITLFKELV